MYYVYIYDSCWINNVKSSRSAKHQKNHHPFYGAIPALHRAFAPCGKRFDLAAPGGKML